MKNFVAHGNALTISTEDIAMGESIIGGMVYSLGGILGVAAASVEVTGIGQGRECVLQLTGVFDVPKQPSQPWLTGTRIYWDSGNRRATTTATGNMLMGIAARRVGGAASETTGRVRLNGVAV